MNTATQLLHRSVLLVGGPDAGKTNYLSRLWLSLQHGTGCLQNNGLPDFAEYLNTGAMTLLGGDFVGRTPQVGIESNVIPVKWQAGGMVVDGNLVVPDCSGEEWEKIHRAREWSASWEQTLPTLRGCVLFIRAGSDRLVPALDWVTCGELLHLSEASTDENPEDQEAVRLPSQVVLVDWLQCLSQAARSRPNSPPLRIAIVIAAWDCVPMEQQRLSPDAYVDANFPMLSDFVKANPGLFGVKYFGVSVAGGDFDSQDGFKDRYLDGNPNTAGFVVQAKGGNAVQCADHTLPVAWAMGLDDPFTQAQTEATA